MSSGTPRKKAKGLSCEIVGCGRPRKARGLCNSHYLRQLQKGVYGGHVRKRGDVRRQRLYGSFVRVRPHTFEVLKHYAENRSMTLPDFVADLLDIWAQERNSK
jgi:hypothetical protein